MKPGMIIRIPDAVASRAGGKETVQPGLPGRWSIWSQAGGSPGAHFVVPSDSAAEATAIKYATVRITQPQGESARIQLIATDPPKAMPKTHVEQAK